MATSSLHLVVPGQVIATSSIGNEEDSFLRGHGTYLEKDNSARGQQEQHRLIASVCGIVQRVNKLITVLPCSSTLYTGNVGDLVVGRIVSVGNTRWKVKLTVNSRDAQLPLSGVHIPGVQRVRTAQDQRDMRRFFCEGDLVSAEVHNVHPDGTLVLHTRSSKYGKLDNGCLISNIPPALIPRRKNHYITMLDKLDVVWGMNGNVWIQRKLRKAQIEEEQQGTPGISKELTEEIQTKIKIEHSKTPIDLDDRIAIVRLRNSIECLRLVHCMISPENAEAIYHLSIECKIRPADMLLPNNIIQLTEFTRK